MNIKRYTIGVVAGMAALVMGMTTAVASHGFTPPPAGQYTLNGTLQAFVGFIGSGICDSSSNISLNGNTTGNVGVVNSLNLTGSTTCNNATVISVGDLDRVGSHTIVVRDVSVNTSIGECYGDLAGQMSLVSGNVSRIVYERSFSNLSADSIFGSRCEVEGFLDF